MRRFCLSVLAISIQGFTRCSIGLALIVLAALNSTSMAQDPAAGIQPYSTQIQGTIDSIDLATGSIFFRIPIRSKIGKLPVEFSLEAQSRAFIFKGGVGVDTWLCCSGPALDFTYRIQKGGISGLIGKRVRWSSNQIGPCNGHNSDIESYNFLIQDAEGTVHTIDGIDIDQWGCLPTSGGGGTTDGSGYGLDVIGNGTSPLSLTVSDRAGNQGTASGTTGVMITSTSDPDNFKITDNGSAIIDTLGTTFLSYSFGSSGAPDTYSWTDATPMTRSATVSYSPATLQTKFGCPNIVDISAKSTYLPTSISLPNGDSYTIAYEPTPVVNNGNVTGRISQITFSSGGYVAFSYTGGNYGIDCNSSVVPILTRTLYDKTSNTTTTHTYVHSTAGNTVVVTDYYPNAYGNPNNNRTVYAFMGEFVTQVSEYQGSSTNPSRQTTTCYNAIFTNCAAPAFVTPPIKQVDTYIQVGTTLPRLVENQYDSDGNVTQQLTYDWGAGTPPLASKLLSNTYSPSLDYSRSL